MDLLTITREHTKLLEQCLGLGGLAGGRPGPTRNYMVVLESDENMRLFNTLLAQDLVSCRDNPGGSGYVFSVTLKGLHLLPQVMALGSTHRVVEKIIEEGNTLAARKWSEFVERRSLDQEERGTLMWHFIAGKGLFHEFMEYIDRAERSGSQHVSRNTDAPRG